jgi:hypothetical protein
MENSALATTSVPVAEALRRQLRGLETLAGLLSEARGLLPDPRGDGVWRGEAHRLYLSALEHLTAQVRSACSHVDDAIRDTRQALDWAGRDGG